MHTTHQSPTFRTIDFSRWGFSQGFPFGFFTPIFALSQQHMDLSFMDGAEVIFAKIIQLFHLASQHFNFNFTFSCCKWGLVLKKYQEQVFCGSRKTHTLFLLSQWFVSRERWHFHWHMSRFAGVVSLPQKNGDSLMKSWLVNSPIEWL